MFGSTDDRLIPKAGEDGAGTGAPSIAPEKINQIFNVRIMGGTNIALGSAAFTPTGAVVLGHAGCC